MKWYLILWFLNWIEQYTISFIIINYKYYMQDIKKLNPNISCPLYFKQNMYVLYQKKSSKN